MGVVTSGCCSESKENSANRSHINPLAKSKSSNSNENVTSKPSPQKYPTSKKLLISPSTKQFDIKSEQSDPEMEQQLEYSQNKMLTFADFIIIGELGSGNFGSVYLVQLKNQAQCGNPTKYALKKINKQVFENKKLEQSTKLEMSVMMKIRNPFLTELKFSFSDSTSVYFIMEYAQGGSVQTLLSLKKMQNYKKNIRVQKFKELGQKGIRFIIASVVLALQNLHRNQIIYRDLKPQNVIIFEDGYVKLTDFGLSRAMIQDEKAKTEAGTILYFAPEIVLRKGYCKLVDLWQLGIFAYELATSESPFRQEQILIKGRFEDVIRKFQKDSKWESLSVSQILKNFIVKLLKYNPKDRLGANGFSQLKSHEFLKDINWQQLQQKRVQSPLRNIVKDCPLRLKKTQVSAPKTQRRGLNPQDEWNYDYRSIH